MQRSSMAQAFGREAWKKLPACRGRHPHLATFEECGAETRTLGLGATNGWFAMRLRAFSLPRADSEVDQRVAENWGQLSLLLSLPEANARALMPNLACWPDIEPYGVDAVWQAIVRHGQEGAARAAGRRRSGPGGARVGGVHPPDPIELPDFTTRREPPPAKSRRVAAGGGRWSPSARGSRAVRLHQDRRPGVGCDLHRGRAHRPADQGGSDLGALRADPR